MIGLVGANDAVARYTNSNAVGLVSADDAGVVDGRFVRVEGGVCCEVDASVVVRRQCLCNWKHPLI